MGKITGIQWTDHTLNLWTGCTKVAEGCLNCYMFAEQTRYGRNPSQVVRTKPTTWRQAVRWNREAAERGTKAKVFVCSWSDFWHSAADPWRSEAFNLLDQCPDLVFQIPTKRPERIRGCWTPGYWMMDGGGRRRDNVWLGASASNQDELDAVLPPLLGCRDLAPVLFLSLEPLVGPVDLDGVLARYYPAMASQHGNILDWVIVGGESGPKARPCNVAWVRDIVHQCRDAGVPCFVKQLGARPMATVPCVCHGVPTPGFPELSDPKGGDPEEWPEDLRVREFPIGHAAEKGGQ